MSAEGKKKDKGFIALLVLIIVCACLMIAAVTTLGIGMSNGVTDNPGSGAAAGTVWSSGEGAPAADTGKEGDFYLDTSSGNVYQKTADGWSVVITIPLADEITPSIGEDGYWYIGDRNTNVKAAGTDGLTPSIGEDGYWYIGGVKTDTLAGSGEPKIGENGNWFIGGKDTHVSATGAKWHSGQGKPVADDADTQKDPPTRLVPHSNEGDFYLDTLTGDVYLFEEGKWTFLTSLTFKLIGNQWTINGDPTGLFVAQWWSGVGDPNKVQSGFPGDYYLDTQSGIIYKNVSTGLDFEGKGTEWEAEITLRSNQWFSGNGSPEVNTDLNGQFVAVGDMYLDLDDGQVYQYTADGWQAIEGLILKGKEGARGTRLFSGNGAPTSENPDPQEVETGDLYFDTSKGVIYEATKDSETGTVEWTAKNGDDPLAGTKWLSGDKDPDEYKEGDDMYGSLQSALNGDVYFNTKENTLWQFNGTQWECLGTLSAERATKWFHGSYDPANLSEDESAFNELTAGAIEGDFYLQTFSDFSENKGMKIWVYQNGIWTLLVDMATENNDEHPDGYNIPTLDALTEFRKAVNEGRLFNDKEEEKDTAHLKGAISVPEEFAPVGTTDYPFNGVLDGGNDKGSADGYCIQDLNGPLFGYIGEKAEIKNLLLKGKLDVASLATFFAEGSEPPFGSLLTGTFGLAENIADGAQITNVTLELSNDEGTVTIVWTSKDEVTVTVMGNDDYALVINGDEYGYNGLLALGNAAFTFKNVKFTGKSYLDVTDAKSLTLENVIAEDVNPVEACKRNPNGTPVMMEPTEENLKKLGLSGIVAEERTGSAAFIVSRDTANAENFALTIKDSKINAAQSDISTDAVLNSGLQVPDANSMAILLNGKVTTVDITGTTFGTAEKPYTAAVVKFASMADKAVLTFKGNTVYGTRNLTREGRGAEKKDFSAFVLGGSTGTYEATFENNTVSVDQPAAGGEAQAAAANEEGMYFLSFAGTGRAQVYLVGETNKFNGETVLYRRVKAVAADENNSFDFLAFNAEFTEDEDKKLIKANVYLGSGFGKDKEDAFAALNDKAAEDSKAEILIIDLAYEEPLAFVQHLADHEDHYYINNEMGLGYFRDSVNGIEQGDEVMLAPDDYEGKFVVIAADGLKKNGGAVEPWELAEWTVSVGSYAEAGEGSKPFKGTFEGNGAVFKGLKAALFGNLGENAKIGNFGIDGAEIEAEKFVGAVASVASGNVTISDVAVTNTHLTLSMPTDTGTEPADVDTTNIALHSRSIGGIVGAAGGKVTLKGVSFGDYGGNADDTSSLNNKYSIDNLNYLVYNYGLVGSTLTEGVYAEDSWANKSESNGPVAAAADMEIGIGSADGENTFTASFNAHIIATDLQLSAIWTDGNAAPSPAAAQAEDEEKKEPVRYGVTVTAYTAKSLISLRELVVNGITFEGQLVRLGADIAMNDGEGELTGNNAWRGIGYTDKPFKGTFDGGANADATKVYSIMGLKSSLFYNLGQGATVQNLNLDGLLFGDTFGSVIGDGAKLLLAVYAEEDVTIDNVNINATVTADSNLKVNDFAAAPFGIYAFRSVNYNSWGSDDSKDVPDTVSVTNTNVTVVFSNDITFHAEIDKDKNSHVSFTGDDLALNEDGTPKNDGTFADGTTMENHEYQAVITDQIFRLGGFHRTVTTTGPTADFTFTGIKFTGNSFIQLCASDTEGNRPPVTSLTMKNCYADVTPEQATGLKGNGEAGTPKQPAFIVGYEMWNSVNATRLDVQNNVIISDKTADGVQEQFKDASLAIFSWTPFADGTVISHNTFGSADRPFHNAVIKCLDFGTATPPENDPATITLEGNTFWADAQHVTEMKAAIDFAPSQAHPFEVYVKGNTLNILGEAENAEDFTLYSAESGSGRNPGDAHARVFITGDNTVMKGQTAAELTEVTIDYAFVTQGDGIVENDFDFLGYNVTLNDDGKVAGGNFIFGRTGEGADAEAAEALAKYVAEGSEGNIHIVVVEDVGRRLSDMLSGEGGKEADLNTYYVFSKLGFGNFVALVNEGTNGKLDGFSGKTVKFAEEFSAELEGLEGGNAHTLDLGEYTGENEWQAIGTETHPFKGTFDGLYGSTDTEEAAKAAGNWIIKGLDYSGTAGSVGFFGHTVGGAIKNLDITGFKVTISDQSGADTRHIGLLAATTKGTSVENIHVSGSTIGLGETAVAAATGAVVGYLEGGTLSGVWVNEVSISGTGTSTIGAVVGHVKGDGTAATVKNVYVGGTMGTDDKNAEVFKPDADKKTTVGGSAVVGGVIGLAEGTVTVGAKNEGVWSAATVTASSVTSDTALQLGGIIGALASGGTYTVSYVHFTGTLNRTFYGDSKPTTKFANYGLVGSTKDEKEATLKINNSDLHVVHHDGFEQITVWMNGDSPETAEYQITDYNGDKGMEGLKFFSEQVLGGNTYKGETIRLMTDIDFAAEQPAAEGADDGFAPIGSKDHPFEGTFTGEINKDSNEGHKISYLSVLHHKAHGEDEACSEESDYAGLFAYIKDATIEKLTLENAKAEGRERVGLLAGMADGTVTISNVKVDTATVNGHHWVGGLVGYVNDYSSITITGCEVKVLTAQVVPEKVMRDGSANFDNGDKLGGLVGYVGGNGSGPFAFKNNKVIDSKLTAYRDVGGLVGIDNYTPKSTFEGNTVKDTTITVKQSGYTEDSFCTYSTDYTYAEPEKAAEQNAGWLVGRGNPEANANEDYANTEDNVTINLDVPEGAKGFIYSNNEWHIVSAEGFLTFASLASSDEATEHNGQQIEAHFEGQTVAIDGDIDLKPDVVTAAADTATPNFRIKGFKGTFDGHGHTISDMTVSNNGSDANVGFFADLQGDVRNLTFENATVTAGGENSNAGVLAGKVSAESHITNVTVNGAHVSSNGRGANVGGLIGSVEAETAITNVTVNGVAVDSSGMNAHVGGLVGKVSAKATISNIKVEATGKYDYAEGIKISGTGATAAALGWFENDGANGSEVKNFTFYGSLSGATTDANIVLMQTNTEGNPVAYKNCDVALVKEGIEKDDEFGFYYGAHADGAGNILGTYQKPMYFIKSWEGVKAFKTYLASSEDHLRGETVNLLIAVAYTRFWEPLGDFAGTFDGLDHELKADAEGASVHYLFNNLSGTVKNLTLTNIAPAQNLENGATIDTVHVTIDFSGAGMAYYGLAQTAGDNVMVKNSDITVSCADYDAKFTWDTEDGKATAGSDFKVKTEAGLQYLATVVNGGIDFSGKTVTLDDNIEDGKIDLNGENWTPIGSNAEHAFKGTFDGNSKMISGLTITASEGDGEYAGLFGYVSGGEIKNLTIEVVAISSNAANVGVLAGYIDGTTLSNIEVKAPDDSQNGATVESKATQGYVGGIAGVAKELTATDPDFGLKVINVGVSGTHVGAAFGKAEGTVTLKCSFSGALNSTPAVVPTAAAENKTYGMVGEVVDGANVTVSSGSSLTVEEADGGYTSTMNWSADNVAAESVTISGAAGLTYFRTQIGEGNTYSGVTVTLKEGTYELGTIEPIPADKPFEGTFKGEEGKAANTAITANIIFEEATAEQKIGFFSQIKGAEVANITFNMTISAPSAQAVGAVAAAASENSNVHDVTVNANITGGRWVGGIVGYAWNSTASNNTVTGTLSVQEYKLGAIAGFFCGTVENNTVGTAEKPVELTALTRSAESADDGYGMIGGLVGGNAGTGNTITGNTLYVNISAQAGDKDYQKYTGAIIANGSADTVISGNKGAAAITVSTVFLPLNGGLAGDNNAHNYSAITDNHVTVTVSWSVEEMGALNIDEQGFFTIGTGDELGTFRNLVNAGVTFEGETVILTDDISLEGETTPIGSAENPFKGTFDGNGHTISNLSIKSTSSDGLFGGLFGYIVGTGLDGAASVKNLTLNNVTVMGYAVVGSVAGAIENGLIEKVSVLGNIELVSDHFGDVDGAEVDGGTVSAAGGISGILYASSLKDCTVKHSEATAKSRQRAAARLAEDSEALNENDLLGLENTTHVIAALQYAGGVAAKLDLTKLGDTHVSMAFEELEVSGMLIQILGSDKQVEDRAAGGLVGYGSVPQDSSNVDKVEVHDNLVRKTDFVFPKGPEGEETDVKFGAFFGEKAEGGKLTEKKNNASDVYIYEQGTPEDNKHAEETMFKEGFFTEVVEGCTSLLGAYEYKDGSKVGNAHWYEIYSAEALLKWNELVTGENAAENLGVDVYLMSDVTLQNSEKGGNWVPVGTSEAPFTGNFYGNDHIIAGIHVVNTIKEFAGFFGVLGASTTQPDSNIGSTVSDLSFAEATIEDSYLFGGKVGVLAGRVMGASKVDNVIVLEGCTVSSAKAAGGLIGYVEDGYTVTYTDQSGKQATASYGESYTNYKDGVAEEQVNIDAASAPHVVISNCINYATVTAKEKGAGIVGHIQYANVTFENCVNHGAITAQGKTGAETNAGGIVGYVMRCAQTEVTNCANYGDITATQLENGKKLNVGGIICTAHAGTFTLTNVENYGNITATDQSTTKGTQPKVGGLIGSTSVTVTITNAVSEGAVTCTTAGENFATAGGVMGYQDGGSLTVTNITVNCTLTAVNEGETATRDPAAGAINGFTTKGNATLQIENADLTVELHPEVAQNNKSKGLEGGIGIGSESHPLTVKNTTLTVVLERDEDGTDGLTHTMHWDDSGEFADDGYTVTTAEGLVAFGESVNAGNSYAGYTVFLGADLDLKDIENWAPIGTVTAPFRGEFDGDAYTISNLTVNTEEDYAGLFGYVSGSAKIHGVNLLNANVTGKNSVGALLGMSGKISSEDSCEIYDITAENVTVTGEQYVGGVIGHAYLHRTANITVKGLVQVTGNWMVGGVIGGSDYSSGENLRVEAEEGSFVTGEYSKDDYEGDNVGGVVGYIAEGGISLTNLYAENLTVSGTRKVGGILGFVNCGSSLADVGLLNVTVICNPAPKGYAGGYLSVGGVVGEANSDDGSESTITVDGTRLSGVKVYVKTLYENQKNLIQSGTEQYASQVLGSIRMFCSKNVNLNITGNLGGVTVFCDGMRYGGNGIWYVDDVEMFKTFRDNVDGGKTYAKATVYLTADIDLQNENWDPIGASGKPFSGIFDGLNHTISNLLIEGKVDMNSSEDALHALFAHTTIGKIKNFTVKNAKVTGGTAVAVVAAEPYTASFDNIRIEGHVEVLGFSYVACIGGYNAYGDYTNITVNVDETSFVKGTSQYGDKAYRTYVGGIVGHDAEANNVFENIDCNIDVIGDVCNIGGIVGLNYGSKLVNCKYEGTVTVLTTLAGGEFTQVGGIAGAYLDVATFADCTFNGTIVIPEEHGDKELVNKMFVGSAYNSAAVLILVGTNTVNGEPFTL